MREEPRRAFGADRIETAEGGEIWVVSPNPKAWLPRQEKTLTRAEYPGTAVDWMGGVFEVLRAEPLPDGGMRYRLAPWEDAHTIRRMERYDADSETARAAESRDGRDRVRKGHLSILLAPLAGFLPGAVQKEMENEFGAPAVAMTISSALPLAAIGFLGVFAHFLGSIGGALGFAVWISPPFPIALYLFAESTLRLASAVAMSEPMGSLPVVVAWQVWREAREPARELSEPAGPARDVAATRWIASRCSSPCSRSCRRRNRSCWCAASISTRCDGDGSRRVCSCSSEDPTSSRRS